MRHRTGSSERSNFLITVVTLLQIHMAGVSIAVIATTAKMRYQITLPVKF